MPVHIPTHLDDALALLSERPESHMINVGTDVMVEVNFNHRHPETVIALRAIPELQQWSIDHTSSTVFIGSGVPYAQMEKGQLAAALPALAEAARTHIGKGVLRG